MRGTVIACGSGRRGRSQSAGGRGLDLRDLKLNMKKGAKLNVSPTPSLCAKLT